jgi:hypothetical protein
MPKSGDKFTFSGDEPFGTDPGAMHPGTEVTVRETVKADVVGAHTGDEDAVVVEWGSPEVGRGDSGEPVIVTATRATSFGADFFNANFSKES